ncbi:MAG: c-type cytochrome, methanol metabolism-related [Hyphomicrobiales bacterium]
MFRPILTIAALAALSTAAQAVDVPAAQKAVSQDPTGKYMNAAGEPTYNIKDDGTIDWFTYSGFRMYHAECHVCHGPEGEGSSYAPRLVDSLKVLSYDQFKEIVTNGKQEVNTAKTAVMPSFGTNPNVMCYIDDLYLYLKARADGVLPRGRPAKKEPKNDTARSEEHQCLGIQ